MRHTQTFDWRLKKERKERKEKEEKEEEKEETVSVECSTQDKRERGLSKG